MEATLSMQIAGIEFQDVTYDEDADVLYLRKSGGPASNETHATPEGHAVQLDASGAVVGLTIVNARWLIEREGRLVITIPQRVETSADDFAGLWASVQ
jgi:uncharacterized protein YuzE